MIVVGNKKSVLLVPIGFDNVAATEKLREFAKNGGKIIAYASADKLESVDFDCEKVDINGETENLMKALDNCGWSIKFKTLKPQIKLPSMSISIQKVLSLVCIPVLVQ